jgi:tRNA pseudouridine38-40 synthase
MPRVALGIEYDGADFVGWQIQKTGRSVQETLAAAVAAVAAQPVRIHAAGRTDTGVHASGQVVHFDADVERSPRQWALGINANLPGDVAVRWAQPVPDDFDARRSALARCYRYSILVAPTRPALCRRRVWWLHEALDCAAMTRASLPLIGEHDFSAFRASNCQSVSPVRRLERIGIQRRDGGIELEFVANAFLYRMVRNLVGLLVEIGRGRAEPPWARAVLAGRDRARGAQTAPAQGLTFVDVAYPERFRLPVGTAIIRNPGVTIPI